MTVTKRNGTVPEFDFSYLHIENKTAQFELPWLYPGSVAFLLVKPANESNPAYQSESLRMSGNRQTSIALRGSISTKDADRDRQDDVCLYPLHVITGWSGVQEKKTRKEVPFTEEACTAFLKALPVWIIDKLRLFCMRPEGFLGEEAEFMAADPDAHAVAKN